MEDALFNALLFTAFYVLYSNMFAPKTNRQTVAVVKPVVQPTQTVVTAAAKTDAVKTAATAAVESVVTQKIAAVTETPIAAPTDNSLVETPLIAEPALHQEPDQSTLVPIAKAPEIDSGHTAPKAVGFNSLTSHSPGRSAVPREETRKRRGQSRQLDKQTALAS